MRLSKSVRRHVTLRHGGILAAALLLAFQASFVADAPIARASQWHNTNPTSTPCGDNSHPIKTWRSYYVRTGSGNSNSYAGTIVGRIDIRYSRYCNTVWARAANLTNSSVSGMAKIFTYNCAEQSGCSVDNDVSGYTVLPDTNDTVHTNQLDLPIGKLLGGDRMPPTVRAEGWIDTGPNTYSMNTGREPVFTQWESAFKNEPWERVGSSRILSCQNNGEPCESWGTPGGSWATIEAEFQPNFPLLVGVDAVQDMLNIMDKWNYASQNAPLVTRCTFSCTNAKITVRGQYGLGNPGSTDRDGSNGLLEFAIATFDRSRTWDHSCGSEGNGCTDAENTQDIRPVLSHEWAHVVGFTHCDLNFGVMCHRTAANGSDEHEGTMFWTPQHRDVLGLEAAYPD
jgi:hypothetical protein